MQHFPNNADFKGPSWLTYSISIVVVPSVVVSIFFPYYSASHKIRGPAFRSRTMLSLLYWMERKVFLDSNYQTIESLSSGRS